MNTERRILVVDDEESVRNAIRRTLRRENYTVHVAASGNEALEWLKKNTVDVIISDHLMPEMTGLEFLKLVHDRYPTVCRIILTGHADMETAIRAINEGEIYRFLAKPWDDTELKVTLHIAFEQLELEAENRKLLAMVRHQADLMRSLEREHPGLMNVVRDAEGVIVVPESELAAAGI